MAPERLDTLRAALARDKRALRRQRDARRVAYHLDLGMYGYVEEHVAGWYRWFPSYAAHRSWLVEAEALVMQPAP